MVFIIVGFQAMSCAEPQMSGLQIASPGLEKNGFIHAKYTCDGADINPQLLIAGVPKNTK
jgi:phosphatidylethanolamine-binding protein (PEBP) family uncharacterized protein